VHSSTAVEINSAGAVEVSTAAVFMLQRGAVENSSAEVSLFGEVFAISGLAVG